uniref:Protein max n=1 Tax=Tabanus bromius TaxID=304241 RepID=A0A0K8TN86_TABBR
MSDDDRDIDIESDEENDSDNARLQHRHSNSQNSSQAEKRAHHNALERKRRDHIKDSFNCLKDAVPSLQGEKVHQASRAQILKKAAEYIQFMRRKNMAHQKDIDDLRRQNSILETQIRQLEKAKDSFSMDDPSEIHIKSEPSDSSEGEENDVIGRRNKKMKTMYAS